MEPLLRPAWDKIRQRIDCFLHESCSYIYKNVQCATKSLLCAIH